jgi:hypothetical protein
MTQATPDVAPDRWVPDDLTFGARLALVRQRMGWGNVAQAARECGVPTDSWRNWEEGMEPRRIVTICMAIAARTGADIDWLVYGPSRANLEARAKLTLRYSPTPPARVLPPVLPGIRTNSEITHRDGRLRTNRRPTDNRPSRGSRHERRPTRPVSQLMQAERAS